MSQHDDAPAPPAILNAPARFRLQTLSAHLTYPGHIAADALIALAAAVAPLVWHSVVWERSDGANAYDHTHFAFGWATRQHIRCARTFDLGPVHPNIVSLSTALHRRRVFTDYHRKSPVQLWQSEFGPDGRQSVIQQIQSASSLMEACDALGIIPRTVGDVNTLRNSKSRPDPVRSIHLTLTPYQYMLWAP